MATRAPRLVSSHLKMRQLQLLAQLRETGSVIHAAEALNMSQSAASRLLSSLESDVGVALFERHARGVSPTPVGEIVTRRAVSALAEMARAGHEVQDFVRGNRLPLSIGGLLSLSSTFLPRAVLELARQAPDLLIKVDTDRSRTLIDGLLAARFDVVIARVRDASLEPDLVFEPLSTEPIKVYVRPGHALSRRRRLGLADVTSEKWVLPPPETDMRVRLDALCVQSGLPRIAGLIETLSVPVILSVVRMSDALVALPREFARPFCDSGLLSMLAVDLGDRTENVGIITRRHHDASPPLRQALRVFREVSAAMYGSSAGELKAGSS
ncbi:LysR family transcriptional regulator [Hydrogenophaga sp.]|uniref:LysR family transcriptional regulator n=1 Tax=Hydrogenophaga sp. TaxID=1904254 RepID=UPI002624E5CA|nr:LysR family transcriptional regulator [Hydrogenophaga sp.]MCW5653899.1 LysR family transcriptional regulator [Hydrogenophaga sp.]